MGDEDTPRPAKPSVGRRCWDIVIASFPVAILIATVLIHHEGRISKLESNRFTDADAARAREELREFVRDLLGRRDAEIQALEDRVHGLEHKHEE